MYYFQSRRPLCDPILNFFITFLVRTAAAPQLAGQLVSLRPEAAKIWLRRRHWRKWRPRKSSASSGGHKSFWRCTRVTWSLPNIVVGLCEIAKSFEADRKSQARQCLGFFTAYFWSSLAYESAEQKPKHCLTPRFLMPTFWPVAQFPVGWFSPYFGGWWPSVGSVTLHLVFFPSKVVFLSSLLTKSAEIWYTFKFT